MKVLLKRMFLLCVILSIVILAFPSCSDESIGADPETEDESDEPEETPTVPDDTPPSKISLTGLSVGGSDVIFSWDDPPETDFDHLDIELYLDETYVETFEVAAGLETCTKSSLSTSSTYTFIVRSADTSSNKSEPYVFSVITLGTSGQIPREFLKIYTADDLNAVRGGVSGYDGWDLGKNYILMADIDLDASGYSEWVPLAEDLNPDTTDFDGPVFTGAFAGNDHEIKNLTITTDGNYLGLFGEIGGTGACVQGLTLVDLYISGGSYVGGLVGNNIFGSVLHCEVTGTIDAVGEYIGGIVGVNDGKISFCSFSGTIGGEGAVDVGGISGDGGVKILGCRSDCIVTGDFYLGGITGSCSSSTAISMCYSKGTVGVLGTSTWVGGIVGDLYSSSIENSYSTADVSGDSYIGGLAGNIYVGIIHKCYAVGDISGTVAHVGGVIGFATDSTGVSDVFFDYQTTGMASGYGSSKSTADMKNVVTYTDTVTPGLNNPWDFVGNPNEDTADDDVWAIDAAVNSGYPYLMSM